MSRNAPVYVRRHGFLAAVAYGVFGTLTAIVVCATGLGVYALHVADDKADRLLSAGAGVFTSLPEIQESLPPVLSDMLQDRRSPSYREQVDLNCRLVASTDGRPYNHVVIEATNHGPATITLMALRVVLVDDEGVPVRAMSTYAATPATIENDWRGPLLPGSTRQCSFNVYGDARGLKPIMEVTDLRVWEEGPTENLGDRQAVGHADSQLMVGPPAPDAPPA